MQNLFHHGYRNHQEYVSDCDVVLVAIKKGKGKIHQKMFDEKETKKISIKEKYSKITNNYFCVVCVRVENEERLAILPLCGVQKSA